MADAYTPNYHLTKPEVGASVDTWGDKLNDNANILDSTIKAVSTQAQAAADAVATVLQVPVGGIMMWFGTIASIPVGWVLCDGTNGTPDMRERFVFGAGPSRAAGDRGGSFTSSTVAAHNHGAVTGGHALTKAEMPPHDHGISSNIAMGGGNGDQPTNWNGNSRWRTSTEGGASGAAALHNHSIIDDGGHSHTLTPPYLALLFIMRLAAA